MHNIAVIILAAGNSSRMGAPKQALPYHGATLLQHVVREAVKVATGRVYVVTGAHADVVLPLLQQEDVHIVQHANWEAGMGTSISAGIAVLPAGVNAVILAVADQPFISAAHLHALTQAGKGIVASGYEGVAGTPVLFHQRYFDALRALKGAGGAQKIISQFPEDVALVPFPQGAVDIDTPEDYQKILRGPDGDHGAA